MILVDDKSLSAVILSERVDAITKVVAMFLDVIFFFLTTRVLPSSMS